MADLVIRSLRGGLNNTDSPTALPDDQCIIAENVEWITSQLGERRRGADGITVSGDLASRSKLTFLHRHVPGSDETAALLVAFGVTGEATGTLAYKDTSWNTITLTDAVTITSNYEHKIQAQSLHGKMFIAYKSGEDRLHVWEGPGNTLRRCGLAEPDAPTGANDGGVGTFSGTRYYRVRYTFQSGGITLRRSEPSDVLTFAPNGNDTGIVVTKPATISEFETHWELEASLDNTNFYVLATTVVGTTTVTDTTAYENGYASSYELSEDIGDYSLLPSARYLLADEDRLLTAGSFEDSDLDSRVMWTPVNSADGVGNDERWEADTDPFLDLDPGENGPITGMAAGLFGSVYVFKRSAIYQLVRTNQRSKAYKAYPITKNRGALPGSIVTAVDETGNPALYFLDPNVGACRLDRKGVQQCGADIFTTWQNVNLDAVLPALSIYYPTTRQIHWWVASTDSDITPAGSSTDYPNLRLVLHTNLLRPSDTGLRGGWAMWPNTVGAGSSNALAVCLGPTNIEANAAHTYDLVPFLGMDTSVVSDLIWRTDTGTNDNGNTYLGYIATRSFMPRKGIHNFGMLSGSVVATAESGSTLEIYLGRDFGLAYTSTITLDFTPDGAETHVVVPIDNLSLSECKAMNVEWNDPPTANYRWELHQVTLNVRNEQMN